MANLNDMEFMSGPMPQDKKKVSFFVSRGRKMVPSCAVDNHESWEGEKSSPS